MLYSHVASYQCGLEVGRPLCVHHIPVILIIAIFYSTMFVVFRSSWAHIFNDDPGEYLIAKY